MSRLGQLVLGEPCALALAAVTFEGSHAARCISFAALQSQICFLAAAIATACGESTRPLIALIAPLSAEAIVAMLAIWRVNGVYMPVDAVPAGRLVRLLARTGPAAVITDHASFLQLTALDPSRESGARLPPTGILTLDILDGSPLGTVLGSSSGRPGGAPAPVPRALPPDVAYILFTSGSTGTPKGVMGTSAGLLARLRWSWEAYPYAPGELCACKTALTFVDSLAEILAPLGRGVPLLLLPPEMLRIRPDLVWRALRMHGVTRITTVPTALRMLLDQATPLGEGGAARVCGVEAGGSRGDAGGTPCPAVLFGAGAAGCASPACAAAPGTSPTLPALRVLSVSGEPLSRALAFRAASLLPHAAVLNLYGCTEVAADVTCLRVPASCRSADRPGAADDGVGSLGCRDRCRAGDAREPQAHAEALLNSAVLPLGAPICGALVRLAQPEDGRNELTARAQCEAGAPHGSADSTEAAAWGFAEAIGATGEIWISGDVVAAGYFGEDELPSPHPARFVVRADGSRWFRTGDLGQWAEDGQLLFAGRADDQLKVRGVRVQPAEVEAAVLGGVPALAQAVALPVAGDDPAAGPMAADQLALVCTLRGGELPGGPAGLGGERVRDASTETARSASPMMVMASDTARLRPALRRAAAELLPEAMRPTRWLVLSSLPVLASGKVDRAALRARLPYLLQEAHRLEQPHAAAQGELWGVDNGPSCGCAVGPNASGGARAGEQWRARALHAEPGQGDWRVEDLHGEPDSRGTNGGGRTPGSPNGDGDGGAGAPTHADLEALSELLCSVLGRVLGLGGPLAPREQLVEHGLNSVLAVRAAHQLCELAGGWVWDAPDLLVEGRCVVDLAQLARWSGGRKRAADAEIVPAAVRHRRDVEPPLAGARDGSAGGGEDGAGRMGARLEATDLLKREVGMGQVQGGGDDGGEVDGRVRLPRAIPTWQGVEAAASPGKSQPAGHLDGIDVRATSAGHGSRAPGAAASGSEGDRAADENLRMAIRPSWELRQHRVASTKADAQTSGYGRPGDWDRGDFACALGRSNVVGLIGELSPRSSEDCLREADSCSRLGRPEGQAMAGGGAIAPAEPTGGCGSPASTAADHTASPCSAAESATTKAGSAAATPLPSLRLREAWTCRLDKCVDASPLLLCRHQREGGRSVAVVVGSHAGTVCATDLASGAIMWRTRLPTRVEASCCAAAAGEVVVVGGYDGSLYGLDARLGTWLWRHSFSGEIKAAACALPDGAVLAACWGGTVRALHARTGRLLRRGDVSGPVFATPSVDWERRQVYVADLRGSLSCFTLRDRRMPCTPAESLLSLHWRHTTPLRQPPHGGSEPIFSAPAIGSTVDGVGVVIFGCVDANVYAVNADMGRLLWAVKTGGPVFASPTIAYSACAVRASATTAGERVFIASSSGELLCVDMAGKLAWRQVARLHGHSSPALDCAAGQTELSVPGFGARYAARVVAVGAVDGTIHLFSAADGTALATIRLGGAVFSSCVICAGKIVVGCRDDQVYCIDILASGDAIPAGTSPQHECVEASQGEAIFADA